VRTEHENGSTKRIEARASEQDRPDEWYKERRVERRHLFIWCERSGLQDAYVEDSIMSHLVSNEVQNEHRVKCYLVLQVAYRRTMRMNMRGRIELSQ
jgi:hypothetical protein